MGVGGFYFDLFEICDIKYFYILVESFEGDVLDYI